MARHLISWHPRTGWILVGEVAHPNDPDTALYRLALIRHAATGVYRLDDGLALRSVPQAWARQHDTTRDPAAVALGQRTSPAKARAARINGAKGGRPPG